MVERIVDAGTRVLIERGYQDASTNRIAREAQVSPGSLYHYFADKDEIVAEIRRRLISDFAAAIAPALRHAASETPPVAVLSVLAAVLDALQAHAGLLRALVDRVPAVDQQEALQSVRENLADVVYRSLVMNRRAARHADLDRTTWMVVELTQHLLVRYVLDSPAIERADFLADAAHAVLALAFDASAVRAWSRGARS